MDINSITPDDFRSLFFRDFAYLPVFDIDKLYNQGKRTYYPDTELFYDCLENGTVGELPTDTDYWVIVSDDILNYITTEDIEKAFAEARVSFNQSLFTTDDNVKLGFLYLSAAYLAHDIKAALGGITGTGSFPVSSRSVGSVAESYHIPQAYLDDPLLSFYTQSPYGLKYLALVLPMLRGNVAAVAGRTLP